jgi:GTP cyclohydrolase III
MMKKIVPGDNLFVLINNAVKDSHSTKELYNELNDLLSQLHSGVGIEVGYEDALIKMVNALEILKD